MDANPSVENQKKYKQALLDTAQQLTKNIGSLRDWGSEDDSLAPALDFLTKKVTSLNAAYKASASPSRTRRQMRISGDEQAIRTRPLARRR